MNGDGKTEGRNDWVWSRCLLVLLLSVLPSFRRLSAQVSVHLAAGARYSSTLVHDSIVAPLDLRPTVAPALLVTVRDELPGPWSVDVALDVSPTGLRRHEREASLDSGSFTAASFSIGLRRALSPGISGRVGVGGIRYVAEQTGVFRQGSGGMLPTIALGTTYAPALGAGWLARHRVEIEARYDLHRFITPALRNVGFNKPRPVHRLAVVVSARIGGGRTAP
jgi:hypothetical protein